MPRTSSVQCSKEHVIANLTRLRAVVRSSIRSEDEARLSLAAYTDELQHYPAQAVVAGCGQWARQKATWPALAELIGFIETNDRTAGALPDPNKQENFLARCKRVGGIDALWLRERHHFLVAAMTDHYEDRLTDEHLAICLRHAAAEEFAPPMEKKRELTEEQLLKAWMNNDMQAEKIRKNPSAYFCAQALLAAHANFRERRFREQPELAAKYYGAEQ